MSYMLLYVHVPYSCSAVVYMTISCADQMYMFFRVCCVYDFVCIWVFVRGGVSETSFFFFLHLFFAGMIHLIHVCTCVSMCVRYMYIVHVHLCIHMFTYT